ncbi:MAG: efflux RND transporter periplasmic adaptor subunit [Woeseiaceae bacterium]
MRHRVAIVAAALSITLQALAQDMPAFPPAQVEVASAELRDMAPLVEVSGTVVSLNDSRIAAEVEGVLTWMADVGDAVDAGDVIARIDPRLMQVALAQARSRVARLEADLRYREQVLKRSEELAVNNNVSANLLDESRAQRDQALHQLADARAELERATGDFGRTKIRAAFAGHIVERLASVGEYIGVGDQVVRLVDTYRKEIALPVPIALTAFLQPGLKVRARAGDTAREYEIRTVVPVGDRVSRMVEVRLNASNSDLLVGAPVQASLPAGDPLQAVAVPRDALVERGGSAHLFKINDDGTAEQVTATILSTVGLWVAIKAGIQPGDRVVVRGAERLMPGQAVQVIAAGDTP